MNHKPHTFLPIIGVIVLLAILSLSWFFHVSNDSGIWLFVPRPPIASDASNIHTFYPSAVSSRTITYETDLPLETIHQFYVRELHKRGWHIVCQPASPDTKHDSVQFTSTDEVLEIYEPEVTFPQSHMSLSLYIKSADGDKRMVDIFESRYPLYCPPYLLTPTPTPGNNKGDITPGPGIYPGPGAATPLPYPGP